MGFPTLFLVDKNGEILHKSSGYEDGQEDIYLAELIKYLDNENIDYGDFEYEKQLSNQSDASIMNIDF